MKKLRDIIVVMYLLIVLFIIQISSILIAYRKIDLLMYSYFLIGVGVVGLIIYLFIKRQTKKLCIKDVFVLSFVFYGYVSYLFAYDKRIALWGFLNRNEGLLVIISYYIIFLVASCLKNKKYYKYIIYLLSFNVITQNIYGIFQVLNIPYVLGIDIVSKWKYSYGFSGNSNFLASLTVMLVGIWLGIYLLSEKNNGIKFIILDLFLMGLILCGAMSTFLAFFVLISLIFIYIVYQVFQKKEWKKLFKRIVLVIFVFSTNVVLLSYLFKLDYLDDILELGKQTTDVVKDEVKDDYGTGRVYIWKKTLEYVPKYLITGIGIDQFYYIGGEKTIYDPVTLAPVEKAHNEYLQILVTEGIFMVIVYLIFIIWIFIKAIIFILKNKCKEPIFVGLLFSFTLYAIQAFFNISVTRVAPIFFLIVGLLVSYLEQNMVE